MKGCKGLILGTAINDAKYNVYATTRINGRKKNLWVCPFYKVWIGMIKRCFDAKTHNLQPTYSDCSVVDEWLKFSSFREWMVAQKWQGMALDKDILLPGNKIYSPETCVFIPQSLNNFLTDSASIRGDSPIGVSWHRKTKKFHAECRNPFSGAKESLGYFHSADEGYQEWRKRKHQHACRYADLQTDSRIYDALRSRFNAHI